MDEEIKLQLHNAQEELYRRYGDSVLHILNGQEMYNCFKANQLMEKGIYLPFNEAMCEGSPHEVIFSNEFIKERCKTHHVTMEQYEEITLAPLQKLLCPEYKCIVLWFGEDMFCQINLLTLLAYLDEVHYKGDVIVQLIKEDDYQINHTLELRNIEGYKKLYNKVVCHKQTMEFKAFDSIMKGIELYLEYQQEGNEITDYIKQHIDLKENILITDLFRVFAEYGLGDVQYRKLIKKVLRV